jgi:hypothetical protein
MVLAKTMLLVESIAAFALLVGTEPGVRSPLCAILTLARTTEFASGTTERPFAHVPETILVTTAKIILTNMKWIVDTPDLARITVSVMITQSLESSDACVMLYCGEEHFAKNLYFVPLLLAKMMVCVWLLVENPLATVQPTGLVINVN